MRTNAALLDDIPLKTIEIIRPTKKGNHNSSTFAKQTTSTTTTSSSQNQAAALTGSQEVASGQNTKQSGGNSGKDPSGLAGGNQS